MLEEIVDGSGLDAEVEVEEADGVLDGALAGDDVGLFIGRRGQTIDAVQHLAQRIVFREGPSPVRVVDRRRRLPERRAEALQAEADEAAEEALRTGEPVELEPMPAAERRIVHEFLRERGGVETHSEGDEPERRLWSRRSGDVSRTCARGVSRFSTVKQCRDDEPQSARSAISRGGWSPAS